MTNFVFYNRVARNDQQDPETSRDRQLARILAYAEATGWANVAEYADDTPSTSRTIRKEPAHD